VDGLARRGREVAARSLGRHLLLVGAVALIDAEVAAEVRLELLVELREREGGVRAQEVAVPQRAQERGVELAVLAGILRVREAVGQDRTHLVLLARRHEVRLVVDGGQREARRDECGAVAQESVARRGSLADDDAGHVLDGVLVRHHVAHDGVDEHREAESGEHAAAREELAAAVGGPDLDLLGLGDALDAPRDVNTVRRRRDGDLPAEGIAVGVHGGQDGGPRVGCGMGAGTSGDALRTRAGGVTGTSREGRLSCHSGLHTSSRLSLVHQRPRPWERSMVTISLPTAPALRSHKTGLNGHNAKITHGAGRQL